MQSMRDTATDIEARTRSYLTALHASKGPWVEIASVSNLDLYF